MNNFSELDRRQFRGILNTVLHPSENIFVPDQLKGREKHLRNMRDCFETPGTQAFIWGPRGVGKTSLGHTSCEEHSDIVTFSTTIACEKDATISQIFTDIVRAVVLSNKVKLEDPNTAVKLSAYGFELSGNRANPKERIIIESPNHAVDLLNTIFPPAQHAENAPVVIIDEFDRLQNQETRRMFASVLKQLSVEGCRVQFIFCGVARNLGELIHSHESVERYVYGVELEPLTQDALWLIIDDIEKTFKVSFNRGQKMRLGQISSGYAHFTHLMLKNILLRMYEGQITSKSIPAAIYKQGIQDSAQQAATGLKTAYEAATKKSTDRYVEALWAVAQGIHLEKQFKTIIKDYDFIMDSRPHRERLNTEKKNGMALRNALNMLTKDGHLLKRGTGWYQFSNPMLRSYVRMVAEQEGMELGDESFSN